MQKIIQPGSWDFGVAVTELIKCSSRGIIGADYGVLVKRAGEEFAHKIKDIEISPNQVPIHVIAMGSTEGWGPNRNGDGFKEAALKQYHDTFVKFAKWYRHHKNKNPKLSYGQVKASFYNEPMRRVELLVLLNGNEKAAEEFGGFVADEELKKLAKGEDIPVSMACKVAYDVCSVCGNQAKTRADYCTEDTCPGGGCKENMCKVSEDGRITYVDNPHPTFFDISNVRRPADRIAYGNKADYLLKAASAGSGVCGAELAELFNIVPPLSVLLAGIGNQDVSNHIKFAYYLAELEDRVSQFPETMTKRACYAFSGDNVFDTSPLGKIGSKQFNTGLAALSAEKVSMPVKDFLKLFVDEKTEKYSSLLTSVQAILPNIYNRLIADGDLESAVKKSAYIPSNGDAPTIRQQVWANKMAEKFSLDDNLIRKRSAFAAIKSSTVPSLFTSTEKMAESDNEAINYAKQYALYKLAFLASQSEDVELTAKLIILQNHIN